MIPSIIIGFINNVALLMALALIYDIFGTNKPGKKSVLGQTLPGIILGCIGVAIMMNPWEFLPGVIFDTRSVLLCVTGFFFGMVPTLLTIMITSCYRFVVGGSGVWTGVAVIITSGGVGLAWRYWQKTDVKDVSIGNLYALGMVTHVFMLLWMLTLPLSTAVGVLSKIGLPVLLIFPLGTVLLGKFIINRFYRINATASLKESEEKYRHLYETMTQGVVIQDADGKIIEANQAACKLLGLTMDQILGKTAYDPRWRLIHEDGSPYDPAEMPSNIALGTGMPAKESHCGIFLPEQDEYRWIVIGSVPRFREGETKPFVTMTVFTDITDRRWAEKEREGLLTAIEQTDDMVVITDPDGKIQYVNSSFEAVTGYTCSEALGQNLRMLKSGKQDQAFYQNLWKTLAGGKVWKGQMVNKRKDGTLYTEDSTISPVTDAAGRIVNFVSVKRDITQYLQMSEEKEGLEEQFLQAQKMESVGRLAGGVAHDYNNISSIIIGYTEFALEQVKPEDPLYEDLTQILTAANRSTAITRQLLAFARRQTIAPKVLDLNETIGNLLNMVQRLIGEDIDLAWSPGGEVWPVKIDPSQIDQIIANLGVNARDAITDVGKVTMETQNICFDEAYCADHAGFVPGEFVLLAISDDGCGIAPDILDNIFEPFFTTKGLGKGTGLGLSTVYGIVKQNNGFINVYSEPKKGTTVKIYLARHRGKVVKSSIDTRIAVPLSRGETVLLVEDDDAILKLGKRILEELGYGVLSSSSPGEARRLAKEHAGDINLLITDVIMPEMNGRELSENLQSLYPDLKILFMSGYTANVIAHRGVLDEDVFFISKPFSKKDMAVKIREVLDEEQGSTC